MPIKKKTDRDIIDRTMIAAIMFRLALESLPTDIKKLMKILNLTKAPTNAIANELDALGLLRREKGTGRLFKTKLTDVVLEKNEGLAQKIKQMRSSFLKQKCANCAFCTK